ncbi:hypothetical protein DFH09DRAFT_1209920 [Mycena vulgaris]|nr:hypothetical protein DFH09DRAFT_1209920 [Mycena vulgaris]
MSSLSESSLSLLASESAPPTNTATSAILFAGFIFALAVHLIQYASPLRLTRVLVAAIADTEHAYFEAIESGLLLKSEVYTAGMMLSLQMKGSIIREASLRNSLSYGAAISEFLKGRTFTLLRCIRDAQRLQTHIEILKEAQLRELDHNNDAEIATRAVSLRRRRNHSTSKFWSGH